MLQASSGLVGRRPCARHRHLARRTGSTFLSEPCETWHRRRLILSPNATRAPIPVPLSCERAKPQLKAGLVRASRASVDGPQVSLHTRALAPQGEQTAQSGAHADAATEQRPRIHRPEIGRRIGKQSQPREEQRYREPGQRLGMWAGVGLLRHLVAPLIGPGCMLHRLT
jgi:hypothetical protein